MKITVSKNFALVSLLSFLQPREGFSYNILQLGDSFSSGNGVRFNYYDESCLRSAANWGNTSAVLLGANYDNVACSGATISHLYDQSSSITDTTDLILFSIGGNDMGFSQIVMDCLIPSFRNHADCMDIIDYARDMLASVYANLIAFLNHIGDLLRDDAKVVIVSYPYFTLDKDYNEACCGFTSPNRDVVDNFIALGDELDEVQKGAVLLVNQVSSRTFAYFYDGTKELFSGREPDPNDEIENPDRWIHEFSLCLKSEENYHLNTEGHSQLGQALVPYLEELMSDFDTPTITETVSPSQAPTVVSSPPTPENETTPRPTPRPEEDCNEKSLMSFLRNLL